MAPHFCETRRSIPTVKPICSRTKRLTAELVVAASTLGIVPGSCLWDKEGRKDLPPPIIATSRVRGTREHGARRCVHYGRRMSLAKALQRPAKVLKTATSSEESHRKLQRTLGLSLLEVQTTPLESPAALPSEPDA